MESSAHLSCVSLEHCVVLGYSLAFSSFYQISVDMQTDSIKSRLAFFKHIHNTLQTMHMMYKFETWTAIGLAYTEARLASLHKCSQSIQ